MPNLQPLRAFDDLCALKLGYEGGGRERQERGDMGIYVYIQETVGN